MTDLLARIMIWFEDVIDPMLERFGGWADRVEDRVYEIREKRGQL